MEPEDIIQHKEWKQLSKAEKELLKPLVSGEEEFIHLKNILISAVEDVEAIPSISVSVQQHLQNALTKKRQKGAIGVYFYVAASIVIAIVASWYFFTVQNNDKNTHMANTTNNKMSDSSGNKIKNPFTAVASPPKQETAKEALKSPHKIIVKKRLVVEKGIPKENTDIAINTQINKDENLLAVITEMY